MPLSDLIDEYQMQMYRSESVRWRNIARNMIRHYDFKNLKANRSNSPDRFRVDFVIRRNYHRPTYDEDMNYRTIQKISGNEIIEERIFDSLNVSEYSILFNVRGTFFGNDFNLGYGKTIDDGPIKTHLGKGFREIAPKGHALPGHINDIVENYREIIGKEPERFILHTLEFCNDYINTLKKGDY